MRFRRMPIEIESPEELGYDTIANNLSESSFSDMRLADHGIDGDVSGLLLQYGDHLGLPRLREQICSGASALTAGDVIVTAGAAAALFIVATALLQPGDHVLVVRPNYATNVETPRALGADVEYLDLTFEAGWALDLDRLAAALRPETRLVSVTYPNNPTGAMVDAAQMDALIALVEAHPAARLLVDETYRELAYAEPLPMAADRSARALSVGSMSKVYGLPGLRIGWIAARGDAAVSEVLLAAKEQILLAGATIDEEMAARVLEARPRILPVVREKIAEHLAITREWIEAQDVFQWVEPRAGVVGFVRFRPEVTVDVDRFYTALLGEHGTYVGPGHWFDQDRRSFRLGFAWPQTGELHRGLAGLSAAAAGSVV